MQITVCLEYLYIRYKIEFWMNESHCIPSPTTSNAVSWGKGQKLREEVYLTGRRIGSNTSKNERGRGEKGEYEKAGGKLFTETYVQ